ncbi:methyl-accepting chemotaxis protein [Niveispirillum sp. KHB5.9]|uniref:methyl-accepting chemotaxis protein n=1 Tax=Niveispirillum sp. KHB5.9 TaxID=3400269 RepID=UPI003A85B5CB
MLKNLTIRTRVIAAFAGVLFLTLALGIFSLTRLNAVAEDSRVLSADAMPSIKALALLNSEALRTRSLQLQHVISLDDKDMQVVESQIDERTKQRDLAVTAYEKLISLPEERPHFAKLQEQLATCNAIWAKLVVLSRANQQTQAIVMVRDEMAPIYVAMVNTMNALVDVNQKNAANAAATIESSVSFGQISVGIVLAIAIAASVGAGWSLVTGVVKPVNGMTDTMNRLARHELTVAVEGGNRGDEIGDMARAVQVFKDGLIQADQLAEAQKQEQAAKEARAARINDLIQGFDTQSSAVLRTVSSAATELDATAQSMSAIAEETNRQAAAAAAAAEQTTANVQTVAAAAEEMTASITEINAQVTRSKTISDRAYAEVRQTDGTVAGLAEAAGRIGAVVQLIQDIAGQTNLLALNATIEAARAGEAGKGFAVVASEVKALANQTAKATEEIAAQVTAVQQATDSSVGAIRSIGTTIQSVSEIGTSIAAAMEEQGASTSEISRNVSQAAMGTQEVSANVNQVTEAAAQTGASATQVLGAARELSQQSELLRTQVERFLADIRAA